MIFKRDLMKKHIIILIFIIINTFIAKSQTDKNNFGFNDIKFSYIYSSKGNIASYRNDLQTIILYGISISCTYNFNKNIYTELGLAYKTEGRKNETLIQSHYPTEWVVR